MFNWGGPVKQGIMHGIREPYKHGTQAALVGNPVYPKTGGREHHVWNLAIPAVRALAGYAIGKGGKTTAKKAFESVGKTIAGKGTGAGITAAAPTGFKGYLMRDPMVKAALWAKNAIMSPTAKGWGKSAVRGITSPTGLLTAGWFGYPAIKGAFKKDEPVVTGTGGVPGGGDPGMTYTSPEKEIKVLSDAERKAFANQQREERVQKYLDLMGYDRAKKTAIADALIDASKIVGDRGTLDRKNITQELINPIIQATSKRLDKPDQIREAVGLMATKAEIEKDLSKERDALKTTLTKLQIKGAENTLKESESFEGALGKFLSDRKGAVDKATLERISRLFADAHGETFTVIEEGTEPTGDGLYMIDSGIYRVTEGNAKQIA